MKTLSHILRCSVFILALIFLASCSSMSKSILLGGSIGTATGAAIGSQNERADSGAAIGAVLGAGLGYLIHKQKQTKASSLTSASEKLELDEVDSPYLKSPRIRKYWQKDKIEGRKFIKGHWVYEIEEQPVWMQQ